MLSVAEAEAHCKILQRPFPHLFTVFRPRCQGCRHLLAVSEWSEGVRVWRCNWCNASWRECY